MNPADKAIKAVDRFQRRFPWLAFPVAVWKKFGDDQAGNLAALVAYYAFASILPLLLILVTVLDIVLRDHQALKNSLEKAAVKNYGTLGTDLINSLGSFHGTGPALVIGIVLTFLGARGVANAMQNALNSVWEVPKADRPGFPWNYLRSFGLILAVGLGEIGTSVLSAFITGGNILPGFALKIPATIVTLLFNIGLFWLTFPARDREDRQLARPAAGRDHGRHRLADPPAHQRLLHRAPARAQHVAVRGHVRHRAGPDGLAVPAG